MAAKIGESMICAYGCGNTSVGLLKNGKPCCSLSANSCPSNKKKNSEALKKSIRKNGIDYKQRYADLPDSTKNKMLWNKGINPNTSFTYGGKGSHKNVLIKERGHKCEVCKRSTWNKKPITLELEHKDGDKKNNVKENLLLMCPNCHSQTPTWRRRKTVGKGKNYTDEQIIEAIKSSTSMSSTLEKLNLRWGSYNTILNVMKRHNIDLSVWVVEGNWHTLLT
jgi:hypothetical protein